MRHVKTPLKSCHTWLPVLWNRVDTHTHTHTRTKQKRAWERCHDNPHFWKWRNIAKYYLISCPALPSSAGVLPASSFASIPTHPPTRGGTMDSALHSVTEDCTSRSPLPIIQLKIRDNCRQLHNCHDSGGCSDVWHELVTLRWRQKYSLPQSIMPRQLKWIVRTGEGRGAKWKSSQFHTL